MQWKNMESNIYFDTNIFIDLMDARRPYEVMMALSLCEDEGTKFKDYEDALQYVCAKKVGAKLIVTNDKGFVGLDIELVKSKENK